VLYETEHGPGDNDEVNIILRGRNYGWPNVHGMCDDAGEKEFCRRHDVVEPLTTWTPTVAISGADLYLSDRIPSFRNALLATSLAGNSLWRMTLSADGLLSGTPDAPAGQYAFAVGVTDKYGLTASLELVFTVAEEDGLRGAKALDLGALRSPFGFVLDHASPIGEVITAAPTYKRLAAEFEGTEAHSGIRPEDGRSAIAAAATAISRMELGRLDEETTANVGVIAGGTASNVVAGHCRVDGEARSLDDEKASKAIGEMVDACTWAAGEHECDVDVEVTEMFQGYRLPSKSRSVTIARTALERRGVDPVETSTGGGSDANAFNAAGFETVLLANGTEANHTPEESVAPDRIVQMFGICEAIVEEAAARC